MNNETPETFIWHGRGREDVERLSDAIVRRVASTLYNSDGQLFQYDAETKRLSPCPVNVLHELVARNFTSPVLVARGDGTYEQVFRPLQISRQNLVDLTAALVLRVGSAGSRLCSQLPDRKQAEARDRINMGEAAAAVAKALGVEVSSLPRRQGM